jgi:hypothetical protein
VNGTCKLLAYADDGNLLVENISIFKKNAEAPLDISNEVCIAVYAEKTK